MQASQIPSKVPLPFANSGTKNAIPTASQIGVTAGAASLTDGFPPLTFTPIASGGVPPSGADFNGILNLITAVQQWQSAGGIFKYDAAFSTTIGGYPKGAVLMSTTNASTWLNMVDNNTTDPDAGGANWISLSAGRLIGYRVFTQGTYTYTPTTGTASVLVEVLGGGGAGGGAQACTSGLVSVGAGGGGGGYARSRLTSGFSGVTITVGGGGASNAGGTGGTGGSSSFGALLSATGGGGGSTSAAASPSNVPTGTGNAGTASGGNVFNAPGGVGQYGFTTASAVGGGGGASIFAQGAGFTSNGSPGATGANGNGSGGGGASQTSGATAYGGGAGGAGLVIVWEFA